MAMMGGSEFNIEKPEAADTRQDASAAPPSVTELAPSQKRPAEDDLQEDGSQKRSRDEEPSPSEADDDDDHKVSNEGPSDLPTTAADGTPLSKNQLKRLRRQAKWESKKDDRKAKRKDKRHALQARKREELQAQMEAARAEGRDPGEVARANLHKPPRRSDNPVPVTFILDCGFEQYMRDGEKVSLSSQVVRSYAMVRAARYQAHLFVTGYGGTLRDRFEGVLGSNHKGWKGAVVMEGDFVEAAARAGEIMRGEGGGKVNEALRESTAGAADKGEEDGGDGSEAGLDRSVVYLTSDSPYTLDRLEPYTSYVIGGIVDRNREKGLCYKKAVERRVRTAKLPIGEYMAMQSRFVLTTNQVVEIMAKWLECGSWEDAFLAVIPPRKGAVVKREEGGGEGDEDGQDVEDAREQAEAEAEAEVAMEEEERAEEGGGRVTGAEEALEATGAFTANDDGAVSQTGGGAVPATEEGSNQ